MKTCCVCNTDDAKYKCPTCKMSYCSASCCRIHKETPCSAPPKEEKPLEEIQKRQYDFPTEDTVPVEKLQLLRESQEVRECLKNPHVRDIARAILNDSDPTKAIALAMTEPIFVELADACLKVVEPEEICENPT